MFSLPRNVKVYVAIAPCDMRKQCNGLANTVQATLGKQPRSGDIFVFRNRRGDLVKLLFFDQQGYCVLAKRLDAGTFKWPCSENEKVSIDSPSLAKLLCDIRRKNE